MFKIIKKSKHIEANLKNYEKGYKKFSWKKAEKDLVWFDKGHKKTNIAFNAVDAHIGTRIEDKIAFIFITENGEEKTYTYKQLKEETDKFASLLKSLDIKKGDRVFLFLPRVPEFYVSFLGTLKTGAIAGTLFAAFGTNALFDRLFNSETKILVTNKELYKRLRPIEKKLPELKKIILTDSNIENRKIISYTKAMKKSANNFKTAKTKRTDPAFMLYTSGTTGKPKGVVHCHNAVVLQKTTARVVLDLKPEDIYWCTADPGWVTGVAYGIISPLAIGVTSIVYDGRFEPKIWHNILEKYKVNVWYTAPTAIRMLMRADGKLINKKKLKLRHLCSVGEPLNPEAVIWGKQLFGLSFHDNWWQTETGGILIANYPCMNIKPGSMGRPVPGIKAAIVSDNGKICKICQEGNLAIRPPWPSMMQKIWKNNKKYKEYFKYGWYITGDRAFIDKDGYFWFVGRADDVIKTSGERVGPFEVESALMEHPLVAEAGVIGKPDPLRGEIIKAFIILKNEKKLKNETEKKKLEEELQLFVKKHLAGHAYPREFAFVKTLPKTRSGKIVRRLLRAKELGLPIGDTSTLEEY